MRHDDAIQLYGGHPLAAGLDQVLAAVCDLKVPEAVNGGHIARREPLVLRCGILVMLHMTHIQLSSDFHLL